MGSLVAVTYGLVFFLEKPVNFSYAGDTCVRQLTFLPGAHHTNGDGKFSVSYKNEFKLGSLRLSSMLTCFTPDKAPEQGTSRVYTSPFGGFIARKAFAVMVPAAPRATIVNSADKIPVGKPLLLKLSEPDTVYDYAMQVGKTSTDCSGDMQELHCDTKNMKLAQGKEYTFTVQRSFKEEKKIILTEKLTTLKAARVVKASVANKQTVYSKPKAFEFVLDKPLTAAKASLRSGATTIPVTVQVSDKKVRVTLKKDLERQKEFTLALDSVDAKDGSSLDAPYKLTFTTSGGPRVVSISIGTARVSSSEAVVVQFDQPLDPATDITKMVRMSGGAYAVSLRGNQVIVQLQNLPRCQPFTISVAAGLMSNYGIKSNSSWAYNSRTSCYSLSVYGYSRQGRPLYAYTFGGGGPTTLFVGAIHGSEPSSQYILEDWINELETNPGRIPAGARVVVAPSANPDGVAMGTRNNANNVNLNRNFPTDNWQRNIDDTNGHVANGGGTSPLSEPESRALATLSQSLRPRLLLSYHAVGSVVIGDPGGYSAGYAARYASMVGYGNATGQSSNTFDYSITGSYEDWTIQKVGIPSMVIELGSYYYRNFPAHREAFWAMLR